MSQKLSGAIAVIGIDIGKNSFHVVGQDDCGAIVLRQKWSFFYLCFHRCSMSRGDRSQNLLPLPNTVSVTVFPAFRIGLSLVPCSQTGRISITSPGRKPCSLRNIAWIRPFATHEVVFLPAHLHCSSPGGWKIRVPPTEC